MRRTLAADGRGAVTRSAEAVATEEARASGGCPAAFPPATDRRSLVVVRRSRRLEDADSSTRVWAFDVEEARTLTWCVVFLDNVTVLPPRLVAARTGFRALAGPVFLRACAVFATGRVDGGPAGGLVGVGEATVSGEAATAGSGGAAGAVVPGAGGTTRVVVVGVLTVGVVTVGVEVVGVGTVGVEVVGVVTVGVEVVGVVTVGVEVVGSVVVGVVVVGVVS